MKLLKNEKGKYCYIKKQRVFEIIKTVLMFGCAIAIYLIGFITLGTNKNIWTIIAVLSILPAAKSAVSMIMFFRFNSISEDLFLDIEKSRGNVPAIYELVFTTSERAYYVLSCACCENTIIMLYEKNGKKDLSKELRDHLIASIDREGLKGYSLKIYTKKEDYINRLTEMNLNLNSTDDMSSTYVFALFKAITI